MLHVLYLLWGDLNISDEYTLLKNVKIENMDVQVPAKKIALIPKGWTI